MRFTHHGGARWATAADGKLWLEQAKRFVTPKLYQVLSVTHQDGAELLRTRGAPTSMATLQHQHGHHIKEAATLFRLSEACIAGMIAIEALRVPNSAEMDRFSLRDEDHRRFADYESRPHRVSAGLMQTLLSTARSMVEHVDLRPHFAGHPHDLDLGHLCVPRISILLGAAYMRDRIDNNCGHDPILLVGAYNAGGLYADKSNAWNIRTFGADRIPKFVAYHNDWLAL